MDVDGWWVPISLAWPCVRVYSVPTSLERSRATKGGRHRSVLELLPYKLSKMEHNVAYLMRICEMDPVTRFREDDKWSQKRSDGNHRPRDHEIRLPVVFKPTCHKCSGVSREKGSCWEKDEEPERNEESVYQDEPFRLRVALTSYSIHRWWWMRWNSGCFKFLCQVEIHVAGVLVNW